jgi:hypothetical protein
MADNATDNFVYMGEGALVLRDVVRVRIDPSVLVIPEYAFIERRQLQKIELHDGLREIGQQAFINCVALREVHLSDGVESIGGSAFSKCNFTKFRSPPLVTTIRGSTPRVPAKRTFFVRELTSLRFFAHLNGPQEK